MVVKTIVVRKSLGHCVCAGSSPALSTKFLYMTTTQLKLKFSLGDIKSISELSEEVKNRLLLEILNEMSCDKNSSSFREGVTLGVLGKNQSITKLGYDSDEEPIEVKPKNIISGSNKKLDGSGNFSDFTWARHNKYVRDNVRMLVSGFLDGKVLFVISFDYNSPKFTEEIERQLMKHLPDGDMTSRYVRSVKFSYKHFIASDNLKIEYLVPELSKFENKFTKPFYSSIIEHESNK